MDEKTFELLAAILQKLDDIHNDFLSLKNEAANTNEELTNCFEDICDKLNYVAANQVSMRKSIIETGNSCDSGLINEKLDTINSLITEINVPTR